MSLELSFSNWREYMQLTRMDKPIGIYLLLWPTIWALVIAAGGLPDLGLSLIFIAGVVLMRSAGCIINDYADRKVDGSVKRTNQRPLVAGTVTEKEALQLFALLVGISFLLVLLLNWQTIALSVVALLLAASYPFMKRYTHMPQAVLGAAFGWGIPMVFAATLGYVPVEGWLLFIANLAWTIAYDTYYAMVDRDDDLIVGIKSSAILFGKNDRLIIGLLQLFTLGVLGSIAVSLNYGWPVYVALVACAVLFAIQSYETRDRGRMACFKAFLDNHYVGLVFAVGLMGDRIGLNAL
ncbi:4-hydroxybenzoate octaprenyltransferase [Alteromonas sp. 1_MG-2023]|uniref:4-hydroxybenzoate octaprenyltransferase n=1 Tax=Alteromonas sp. 1_MG-2023 TaxID=3062669 RepID=UPI0026E40370|nr:4-hydroxybenzoate octaprenyltransferase [Alteromonas sp. 1_MG-2023]MDO6475103.1 4-hydroxybenzoate octaprenyltransferase [Alteromonas sp. 1_MG-2023]